MMEHNKRKSHLAPSAPTSQVRERLRERSPPNPDHQQPEANGAAHTSQRPSYPSRTSSTASGQNIMSLPIRPAPPPSGSPQIRAPPNGGLPPAPRRWNSEVSSDAARVGQ